MKIKMITSWMYDNFGSRGQGGKNQGKGYGKGNGKNCKNK